MKKILITCLACLVSAWGTKAKKETDAQRAQRRERMREYRAQQRAKETTQEREQRLERAREYYIQKKAKETTQERAQRLEYHREGQRQWMERKRERKAQNKEMEAHQKQATEYNQELYTPTQIDCPMEVYNPKLPMDARSRKLYPPTQNDHLERQQQD
jgi:hypothetical protein